MNKIVLDGESYINRIFIKDAFSTKNFFYADIIDNQNGYMKLKLHFHSSIYHHFIDFDVYLIKKDLKKLNRLFTDFLLKKLKKFSLKFDIQENLSIYFESKKEFDYVFVGYNFLYPTKDGDQVIMRDSCFVDQNSIINFYINYKTILKDNMIII